MLLGQLSAEHNGSEAVCEAEQVILVLLTVEACCQCSIVGDKLKVDSHLAFEQPCEWVEPEAVLIKGFRKI